MKIAVCEDNAADREQICHHIKQYCEDNHFLVDIDKFSNAEDLLEACLSENYNIIFLDIVMKGLTGIDAARKIRSSKYPCTIVFITVSKDYSFDAYSVDANSYILKPVTAENMERALDKCRRDFLKSSRCISVTTKDLGVLNIPLSNIYYVEIFNKTIYFHVGTHKIEVTQITLNELEKEFGGDPFLRCHRSYIVNMNYIETMKKGEFYLKNGDKVIFSIRSQAKVQQAFGDFITKRLREDLL